MTKRSLLTTFFCAFFGLFAPLVAQTFSAGERGVAVFYADYLEGKPTAYGEVYHRDQLTAAHRTHPAGTLLKVTRLDNKRSVIVRVNDRGAYCDGCVVDLSKVAALQLDLLQAGRAMVSVEVVGRKDATVASQPVQNPGTYNNSTANQHSTYPRPDAGFQAAGTYNAPASNYAAQQQPVNYSNNTGDLQARTPVSYDQQSVNYSTTASNNQLQARGGLNGYEQIKTFDSYNYYEAQAVKQQANGNTNNGNVRSEKATYERLRARGLLPEEKVANNDPSFYDRGGIPQQSQPSSYDQNSEPRINAKGAANPSAYIQWTNTPTSTARPQNYSSESSFPQTYTVKGGDVAPGSYAIQLASYRNLDNAQRQLNALKNKGLGTAYLQEINTGGGILYKVLNGPFSNKETATNELGRYKRDLLLDGIVIRLQ